MQEQSVTYDRINFRCRKRQLIRFLLHKMNTITQSGKFFDLFVRIGKCTGQQQIHTFVNYRWAMWSTASQTKRRFSSK